MDMTNLGDMMNLGKAPIPGDNPAGVDARYDPDFEILQREIDKLASPSGGQVDWKSVVTSAATVLAQRSKDLTAASYLAVGLIRTAKAEGLVQGTRILKDLLENYWETLYPPKKRMRGRAGAITWWFDRSLLEMKGFQPASLPAEAAGLVRADLQRLEELLAAQLPEAPRLGPLLRLIEALSPPKSAADASPPAPLPGRPQPEPASAAQPAAVRAAKAPDSGDPITTLQEARKTLDATFQRMRQASLFMLQHDLKEPLAYRYRRLASWAKIQTPPPNTDGVTQIVSPAPQVRDALATLRDENNWAALIENAEQKLSQFVFWFDLNRYTAEALSALGPDHRPALDTVCLETASLLHRLPGVERLQFADGMPFADEQSLSWLKGIASRAAESGSPPTLESSENPDRYQGVLRTAQALARGKKVVEAVQLLQQQMQNTAARNERMRWQLAIAQILLNAKKHPAALPHLEQLLLEIEEFCLEAWDPGLALESLTAVWQGFGAQSAAEYKARAGGLLQRIARIDPVAALRLSG
jgi:type VI secretion system protein VasJ